MPTRDGCRRGAAVWDGCCREASEGGKPEWAPHPHPARNESPRSVNKRILEPPEWV